MPSGSHPLPPPFCSVTAASTLGALKLAAKQHEAVLSLLPSLHPSFEDTEGPHRFLQQGGSLSREEAGPVRCDPALPAPAPRESPGEGRGKQAMPAWVVNPPLPSCSPLRLSWHERHHYTLPKLVCCLPEVLLNPDIARVSESLSLVQLGKELHMDSHRESSPTCCR